MALTRKVYSHKDKEIASSTNVRQNNVDVRAGDFINVCFQRLDNKTKRLVFSIKLFDPNDKT